MIYKKTRYVIVNWHAFRIKESFVKVWFNFKAFEIFKKSIINTISFLILKLNIKAV